MTAVYAMIDLGRNVTTMVCRGQKRWVELDEIDAQIKPMGKGLYYHYTNDLPEETVFVFEDKNTALLLRMLYPEFEELKPKPPQKRDSMGLPI